MRFCNKERVRSTFEGKRVAIVGSGPGAMGNRRGYIDGHDVVVRVNNYKLFPETGARTDVFYSYFGRSIKKPAIELRRDGVSLCMCKCPNAKFMESDWHRQAGRSSGVDFRGFYRERAAWWFCDTYVPSIEEFMAHFDLLGGHVPTTGFSALLDVLSYDPAHVYLTGFDFFSSKIHNVNERWTKGDPTDPIGHVPDAEKAWLIANHQNLPISMDAKLSAIVKKGAR